jgi:hypothetical protein
MHVYIHLSVLIFLQAEVYAYVSIVFIGVGSL